MPVFTGTNGPETLTGTVGDDDFHPLGGNDTVNGLDGSDRLFWSSDQGYDTFNGDGGYDTAFAGIVDYVGPLSVRLGASSFQIYRPESGSGTDLLATTNTERLEITLGGPNSHVTNFVVHVFSPPPVFDLVFDARANLNGVSTRISGPGVTSFTVHGTSFTDVLVGGALGGNDHLYGYGGTDTLAGLGELVGGAGDDVYFVTNTSVVTELAGEGTDTVYAFSQNFTLPANVETLYRGGDIAAWSPTIQYDNAAIGRGNAENNRIEGFGHLFGMAGDDILVGGAGADVLSGGAGFDTLQGGAGADTADYSEAASGVFVTLHAATPMATNDGDGGTDVLIGIENLTGSAFNDILIGDGGANVVSGDLGGDVLIGLAGNDILMGGTGAANQMQGGAGDDLYRVSAVGDTLVEFAGEGYDTVETTLQTLTMRANFEEMRFTGAGAFTGAGSVDDNLIIGGASADTLGGMGGNDILQGGGGDDLLRGGTGVDQLSGGTGNDTADYSTAAARVVASIGNSMASNDGDGATDTFNSIENLTGSAFNDVLLGGSGSNVLTGGAGSDVLAGLAGDDVLIGGSGAPNQMQGGLGADRYVMTATGDTLIEFAGEGVDTVETTLSAYTLRDNFENLTYIGAGSIAGTGNAENNVLTGAAGADTFTGRGGDDTIHGAGGMDTVVMSGLRADYTVQAGAGYVIIGDSVAGRDGIDTLYGVERIRFSDGEILDVTPPGALPAALDVLFEAPPGLAPRLDDVPLTLPDPGGDWSDF